MEDDMSGKHLRRQELFLGHIKSTGCSDQVLLQGLKNILHLFAVILNVFLFGSITGNQV